MSNTTFTDVRDWFHQVSETTRCDESCDKCTKQRHVSCLFIITSSVRLYTTRGVTCSDLHVLITFPPLYWRIIWLVYNMSRLVIYIDKHVFVRCSSRSTLEAVVRGFSLVDIGTSESGIGRLRRRRLARNTREPLADCFELRVQH